MNQHPYAATTYAQTLTDVRKAKAPNDPLMTLQPDLIAAAIAALNSYALAQLLCPHADTTIDTASRQLRSDTDLWIGAVHAASLVVLGAPHRLLTASLDSAGFAGLISGSQHY
jgi:hypothetical protein